MKVASLRAQVALAAVPWLEQVSVGRVERPVALSSGAPAERRLDRPISQLDAMPQIAVPGLADPLQLASAHAQIDGPRVVLDHIDAHAGKVAFTGEYRTSPAQRGRTACACAPQSWTPPTWKPS